jgi:hypothetical protein
MFIHEAQRQMRLVFRSGSVGLFVSAAVWTLSAALTTWVSTGLGMVGMLIAGFFIYPLTQLVLKALGGAAAVPASNAMRELAFEVAVVGPLMLPLIGAATLHRREWFYPAFMMAIGAHYLPFSFLYGIKQFIALAVIMFSSGLAIGLYAPGISTLGAWFTATLLLVFGVIHLRLNKKEQSSRI